MSDFALLSISLTRAAALIRTMAVAALVGFVVTVPAVAQEAGGWRVGVAEVPPAPEPGAKPRTSARIEVLAGQATAHAATLQAVAQDQVGRKLQQSDLDGWVGVWSATEDLPAGVQRRVLDWSVSPMAIMRTDTDIHQWADLAGRTVCLSADGRYVGELAARHAAIEQVYPSATDALLALRVGRCDAAVQDEGLLRQLLTFPEWRKFSAQLAPERQVTLVQLQRTDLSADAVAALHQSVAPAQLQKLAQQQAKSIAFEVYLDQTVPDCH
ncbi:transporter substrate-binding domain-containing protein [Castellaniella sp.]|uniref:transporter substrate-binding domain-containing protein n=1 Tax=Castellaniella sp. TaxID=1955812 RepID=UPI002AFEA2B9|nr:transporter substrate-binding domain-containing protein [Castellaniella sp.]